MSELNSAVQATIPTVFSADNLIAIGAAEVYVVTSEKGWDNYIAFGKLSITEPTEYRTNKGTPYFHVWQMENYQSNGVSAICAIGKNNGNHVFAKKADGKLWRKRVAGLNAYNLALTSDMKLVKYEDGEAPKAKASGFDESF